MKNRLFLLTAALLPISHLQSAVVFFPSDPGGFNAAVSSMLVLGVENWEESNLAPGNISLTNDPIAPGVASPNFPTGSNPVTGITAQSNTLGLTPATLSPRGSSGIAVGSAGFIGTPSDQISSNSPGDSFDLIISAPGGPARAVSLSPLFFDFSASSSTSHPGNVVISVYDLSNSLLGTQTVTSVDFSQTDYIGIVATGGSHIGRINIYASTNPSNSVAGADDITVYAIPEPSLFALMGLGLLARFRHRKSGSVG